MTLKIGTGTFDIVEVDFKGYAHQHSLNGGFLNPTTPLAKASVDLGRLRTRKVAEYNCQTRTFDAFGTSPDGKITLLPWISIIGVNAKGRNTDKADKALSAKFAEATGKVSVTDTVAEIFQSLGQHSLDIPFKDFVAAFGPDKSWRAYMTVSWIMVQLRLPAGFPPGVICIGVPYEVSFHAAMTFDCKRGGPAPFDRNLAHEAGYRTFPVRDAALRKIVLADLARRIKQAVAGLKWLKQQRAIDREMWPDPEQAKSIKAASNRMIKRARAKLDRLRQLSEELGSL
ncbi:MAG: hypothetical protein AAGM84_00985 [Pseudomonadota bacterium]